MIFYNERCTIVANQDGTIKTAFVDRMGVDNEGRHYVAGQATIGSDELTQFLGVAHSEALATIVRLESDLATKTTEYTTTKAELDAKAIELEASQAANSEANAELTVTKEQLTIATNFRNSLLVQLQAANDALSLANSSLETANQTTESREETISILQAKVNFLESIRTYDPNRIKSESFYQRISGDERFQLGVLALTDDIAKAILAKLDAYLKNRWEVLLDDPEVVGSFQYLLGASVLTEERIAQITKPASRDEAYIPPQPTEEPANES